MNCCHNSSSVPSEQSLENIGRSSSNSQDHRPSAAEQSRSAAQLFQRKLWQALLLSLPVLLLQLLPMLLPPWRKLLVGWGGSDSSLFILLCWVASLLVLWWPGDFIWKKGISSFRHWKLNMFSLVSLSLGSNFFYVSALTFLHFFPHIEHQFVEGRMPPFDSLVLMVILLIIGQYLESKGFEEAEKGMNRLSSWEPLRVTRLDMAKSGKQEPVEIQLDQVCIGDYLRIKPGEKIAFDGVLFSGESTLDESMLSGEAWPVKKKKGDQVLSGSLNQHGSFVLEVQEIGAKRFLAQLLQTVEKMEHSQAPFSQLTDRISAIFTPMVLVAALFTFLGWFFLAPHAGFFFALERMSALLIIACPCALGMAIPMALVVGGGEASLRGILFKKASAIEKLSQVKLFVFDKTGTLTQGRPEVTTSYWSTSLSSDETSRYQSYLWLLEEKSEHPLAKAILKDLLPYQEKLTLSLPMDNFLVIPGKGIEAKVNRDSVLVGSPSWLAEKGVALMSVDLDLDKGEKSRSAFLKTATQVGMAIGQHEVLRMAIQDPLKPDTITVLRQLDQEGYQIGLLSGDRQEVVDALEEELAITSSQTAFQGGISPTEKAAWIEQERKQGKNIAMLGDGINDTVALAAADVGISFRQGNDLAQQGAAIILNSPQISKLYEALDWSKAILKVMHQNLFFAFSYNIIALPVASGLFSYWGVSSISPLSGMLAMSCSSLLVIGNALRLKLKPMRLKDD